MLQQRASKVGVGAHGRSHHAKDLDLICFNNASPRLGWDHVVEAITQIIWTFFALTIFASTTLLQDWGGSTWPKPSRKAIMDLTYYSNIGTLSPSPSGRAPPGSSGVGAHGPSNHAKTFLDLTYYSNIGTLSPSPSGRAPPGFSGVGAHGPSHHAKHFGPYLLQYYSSIKTLSPSPSGRAPPGFSGVGARGRLPSFRLSGANC